MYVTWYNKSKIIIFFFVCVWWGGGGSCFSDNLCKPPKGTNLKYQKKKSSEKDTIKPRINHGYHSIYLHPQL